MFQVIKIEIVSCSNPQMTLRVMRRKQAILQLLVFLYAILPTMGNAAEKMNPTKTARDRLRGSLKHQIDISQRDTNLSQTQNDEERIFSAKQNRILGVTTIAPDHCYLIKSSFTGGYLSIDTNDQLFSTQHVASARTFCVHSGSNTVSSNNKYRMTVQDERGEIFDLRQRNGGIETTKDFTRLIKFSRRPNGSYNLKYGEKQWKDNGDKLSVVKPTECPGCSYFKFEFIELGPNQGDQRKDASFRFGVQDIQQENRVEDAPFKIDVLESPRYPNGIPP